MHSSLIGKIQKANLYAREPERVTFTDFTATFRGEHDSYEVRYHGGRWSCNCHFFPGWGVCSHVMALQKMIAPMLPREAQYSPFAAAEGAAQPV
jgi:hypothetical protein